MRYHGFLQICYVVKGYFTNQTCWFIESKIIQWTELFIGIYSKERFLTTRQTCGHLAIILRLASIPMDIQTNHHGGFLNGGTQIWVVYNGKSENNMDDG